MDAPFLSVVEAVGVAAGRRDSPLFHAMLVLQDGAFMPAVALGEGTPVTPVKIDMRRRRI